MSDISENNYTEEEQRKLWRYLSFREHIKTADGLLWDSHTLLGNAIQFFTKSDINHFSVFFNEFNPDVTERKYQLEALSNGIDFTILSERLLNHKGKVYWLPIKDEYDHWRIDLAKWYLQQEGKGIKYDYKSLIKNVFGRVAYGTKSLFCSEYGYMAWRWVKLNKDFSGQKEIIKDLFKSPLYEMFNFCKAPRPNDMEKMGVWKERILIYDSKEIENDKDS
jgi:hypothetical protein